MSQYESGSLISFNIEGDICGGEKPLFDCATVRELARRAVSVDTTVESSIRDSWRGNGDTHIKCSDCLKEAGVSVHVVDQRPTEELCYVFSEPRLTEEFSEVDHFEEE